MKPTLRLCLISTFWLLAHLPIALTIILVGSENGSNWGTNLMVYVALLLPSLVWGWGLPEAMRNHDIGSNEARANHLSLRLRIVFYLTLPLLGAISTLLVYRSINYQEVSQIEGFETLGAPWAGLVWFICFAYWMIRDRLSRKAVVSPLTFKKMQIWLTCASTITFVIGIYCLIKGNLLLATPGILFSFYGMFYCSVLWLYCFIHNKESFKAFLFKNLVRVVLVLACAVVIGQQFFALAEHKAFVYRKIELKENELNELRRMTDNNETFRAEISKMTDQMAELEGLIPTYAGKPEPIGPLVEKIFSQNNFKIEDQLSESNLRGFYIEHLLAWRIQGDSQNLRKAVLEIDTSPRMINWAYLPLALADDTGKLSTIVALNVFNFYNPELMQHKVFFEKDRSDSFSTGYDDDLPLVWLPPFRGLARNERERFIEYMSTQERVIDDLSTQKDSFQRTEVHDFKRIQKQLRFHLDVADKLHSQEGQLSNFIPEANTLTLAQPEEDVIVRQKQLKTNKNLASKLDLQEERISNTITQKAGSLKLAQPAKRKLISKPPVDEKAQRERFEKNLEWQRQELEKKFKKPVEQRRT